MTHARRNIELKARCNDLDQACSIAQELGAMHQGILRQTDTYFKIATGRLKLREIEGARSELIWYHRSNEVSSRSSDYTLYPITDLPTIKPVLAGALGICCVVRKRRDLYLWKNVRIHLDEVEDLGSFVEFEAVLSPTETEPEAYDRLAYLAERFGIADADRIADSYSDLLMQKTSSSDRV
jgi:predicted adenylyl cyclase CyaB